MKLMLITARQEMKSLRREQLPQALLLVFVGMVSMSSFIGWLTNKNVTQIWQKVKDEGLTSAPNPFVNVSPLYYLRNTVIYLVLVGALLAIVLGVSSMVRDRKAGTLDLVLSRPIEAPAYLMGKLIGVVLWLGMILSIVAAISWTSISFIIGMSLSANDSTRLLVFFGMSLVFLTGFVLFGMISAIYSSRETSALLIPISIWSVITFVLPQLGTADHPVSLLNPVPAIATQGGAFSILNSIFGPFSLSEQFKKISSWILGNSDFVGSPTVSIIVLTLALFVGCILLVTTKRDRLRRAVYE
jgi:ABC-2 type transport system permease protein